MRDELAKFRASVDSLDCLRWAAASHGSARLPYGPVRSDQWAECVGWLSKLAALGDPTAQIVSEIGLPPLYQTGVEAAAHIYRRALSAMSKDYDDVVGRAAPDCGRYSDHQRAWTLREKLLVLAYLKRATHGLHISTAPGYGWAIDDLAKAEGVRLPQWKAAA